MIFPCAYKIDCPGTDDPFANLSSEDPDRVSWYGNHFEPPLPPCLGCHFTASNCFGFYVSYTSQADADEKAKLWSGLCTQCLSGCTDPLPPPCAPDSDCDGGGGNGDEEFFYNSAQSCTVHCADGSPFVYSSNAGYWSGPTQADCDHKAYTYACHQAQTLKLCLGPVRSYACLGSAYSSTLPVNKPGTSSVVVISGTLPPGLSFTTNVLSGTPTTVGTYVFTVRVTDSFGSYMNKTYTIKVLEVQEEDELLDGQVGDEYSYELHGDDQGIPFVWRVSEGTLPPGLILDPETGEIFGTPTQVGQYDFTICMSTL